mgnify:CR=1 FL=1
MKSDNKTLDKIFDLLVGEAAVIANERISEKIVLPEEKIEFSKEHEAKMQKLFKSERNKIFFKSFQKYSVRVASILLVFIIFSAISIFSVSAWRVKFLNFVFDSKKPNTEFEFGDTKGKTYSNDEMTFEYVPDGFELVKSVSNEQSVYLMFKNNDLYFTFSLNDIEGKLSIDTENGTVEKLTINKQEAVYTENKNINALIWHNDEFAFTIMGNIPKEEIIKIAEKFKKY